MVSQRSFSGWLKILFKIKLFLILSLSQQVCSAIDVNNHENLIDILRVPFPNITKEQINFGFLEGGRSQSNVFKIELNGRSYVLRLNDTRYPQKNRREIYMLQEASKRGFAPIIQYASTDASVILMDYITGDTSSSYEAKKVDNIAKLAKVLRQVHDLPLNPNLQTPVFDRMTELYQIMKKDDDTSPELDIAVEYLTSLKRELNLFSIPCVTNHGDLHPCNILLTRNGVMLIDWAENGCEDPFYDLSCFALCHDYNEKEEDLLLTSYLGQVPNRAQMSRYLLNKKMDYVYFAIELFYIARKMSAREEIVLKLDDQIYDWTFYIKIFEKKESVLSPQFFYNFARCALHEFFSSTSNRIAA